MLERFIYEHYILIHVIVIYILSIFVSRYLNMLVYKMDKNNAIATVLWFIPFFNIFIMIIKLILETDLKLKSKRNWFNGKNW